MSKAEQLVKEVADYLNNIIKTTGKEIPKSHKGIWSNYMMKWTDYEWARVLIYCDDELYNNPEKFTPWHKKTIRSAVTIFENNYNPSVTDNCMKEHRKIIWNVLMVLKEVNWDLQTNYNNLFEEDL